MSRRDIPQDVVAEAAVLGAMLLRGGDVVDRCELEARHFYDPRHREVYAAMLRLHVAMKPVNDVVMVEGALGDKTAAVGGFSFLVELVDACATADNAEHYAERVRSKWLLREAIIAASELANWRHEDPAELIAAAVERFSQLGSQRKETAATMRELALAQVREYHLACSEGAPAIRDGFLLTGLADLDRLTGGLELGIVSILAARQSMGKSAMGRTLADGVVSALEGKYGAHTFTMEDPKRALVSRAFSEHSRVPLTRLRSMQLTRQDYGPIGHAAEHLFKRSNWLIDDEAGLSTAQIAMRVRRHKKRLNTKLVVVDYLQHIREPGARDDFDTASRAMSNLVRLARSEEVHVMLVCQLNRKCEEREDKRPVPSDLRASGRLEEDARLIMMLYRDDYYNPESNPGKAELLIRKQSHGPTGTVDLTWDGPCVTYRPATYRDRQVPHRVPGEDDENGHHRYGG